MKELPIEILHIIALNAELKDIVVLGMTCKYMCNFIMRNDNFWQCVCQQKCVLDEFNMLKLFRKSWKYTFYKIANHPIYRLKYKLPSFIRVNVYKLSLDLSKYDIQYHSEEEYVYLGSHDKEIILFPISSKYKVINLFNKIGGVFSEYTYEICTPFGAPKIKEFRRLSNSEILNPLIKIEKIHDFNEIRTHYLPLPANANAITNETSFNHFEGYLESIYQVIIQNNITNEKLFKALMGYSH